MHKLSDELISSLIEEFRKHEIVYPEEYFSKNILSFPKSYLDKVGSFCIALRNKIIENTINVTKKESQGYEFLGKVCRPDILMSNLSPLNFSIVEMNIDMSIGYVVEATIIYEIVNKYYGINLPIPAMQFSKHLDSIMNKYRHSTLILLEKENISKKRMIYAIAFSNILSKYNINNYIRKMNEIDGQCQGIFMRLFSIDSCDNKDRLKLIAIEKNALLLNGGDHLLLNSKKSLCDINESNPWCDLAGSYSYSRTILDEANYVLKKKVSSNSNDVYILSKMPSNKRDEILDHADRNFTDWIIQEEIESLYHPIFVGRVEYIGKSVICPFIFDNNEISWIARSSYIKNEYNSTTNRVYFAFTIVLPC
ncbi:hypothetical protein [Herpetosiphon giganteus]|uniref:hypothetical protein n=1 Tax=Herpetosiphon giganteus TaxID=2029754 RepID=UPI0019582196|nr:hypothetical protein [Herpetosiphon giganteus]MBM7846655.1 hypothetical protein [Herpetosiphon giganteus]